LLCRRACLQLHREICVSASSSSRATSFCFRAICREIRALCGTSPGNSPLFWLRLLRACHLSPAETVQPLLKEADELTAILTLIGVALFSGL